MLRRTLVTLALLHLGCGGSVSAVGDGGSGVDAQRDVASDTSSNPDVVIITVDAGQDSTTPWSPICPEEQPEVGSPCSPSVMRDSAPILCEYGKIQFDINCDTVLQCENGAWTSAVPDPEGCQPDAPNTAACPAAFSTPANGGSCSQNNLRCEYPEGVCICTTGFGGPIEREDAGSSWSCNPAAGCPMPRPRVGSTCSTPNLDCTYLMCDFGENCEDGYWHGELEGCAEPGLR